MSISAEDRARISAAVQTAEAQTSGEIVCVLARQSFDGTALPIFIAAVISLALPWLLVAATAMSVLQMLTLQFAVFIGAATLLCLPRVRVLLIPRAARRAIAHRAALEQFVIRGVAHTKDRAGILIFVSLAERYARIIADEGICARVPQSEWQGAVDALVAHMRDGHIADGYIAAIGACGRVLAKHFPSGQEKRDELRGRIYVL
jgi:putative membrane protein